MTMADCRFCSTRITTLNAGWVHLENDNADHTAEPPLDDAWHNKRVRGVEKDSYGPLWPQVIAKVKLPRDFYERPDDFKPPQRGRRRRPHWKR